ncbi:helix-turn-helix transcriptional regulator (plasmid) [Methylobacterium sp. NMS12]|uniref:helix-turn-helix domain-containing protein n=1 Tax=Methylobacterium sp. NMS12 TaxID=3079766 RepID=UPI003F883E3F
MSGDDWSHSIAVKLFRSGGDLPVEATLPRLSDVPDLSRLPGYVCQAARTLTGLSQQDLRDASMVSKKVINDFENMFLVPSPSLVAKLAAVLMEHGARFVECEGTVGVVVALTRSRVDDVSRSPRRRGLDRAGAGTPES